MKGEIEKEDRGFVYVVYAFCEWVRDSDVKILGIYNDLEKAKEDVIKYLRDVGGIVDVVKIGKVEMNKLGGEVEVVFELNWKEVCFK